MPKVDKNLLSKFGSSMSTMSMSDWPGPEGSLYAAELRSGSAGNSDSKNKSKRVQFDHSITGGTGTGAEANYDNSLTAYNNDSYYDNDRADDIINTNDGNNNDVDGINGEEVVALIQHRERGRRIATAGCLLSLYLIFVHVLCFCTVNPLLSSSTQQLSLKREL